jgi:hypothetical protein
MPVCINLPTGYSSCWVPADIMSNPICDLYCHEMNKHEDVFNILVQEEELTTMKCWMCTIVILFSSPQVSWNHRCSETLQPVTKTTDVK